MKKKVWKSCVIALNNRIHDLEDAQLNPNAINYKELLQKYMKRVLEIKGTDTIDTFNPGNDYFSDEEWNELLKISRDEFI